MIDFSSFAKAAGMLYTSAFLAERYAGIRPFLESKVRRPHSLMPCPSFHTPSVTVQAPLFLSQFPLDSRRGVGKMCDWAKVTTAG